MTGYPNGYDQYANPYQGRSAQSYQDEARQRALNNAVTGQGGQTPQAAGNAARAQEPVTGALPPSPQQLVASTPREQPQPYGTPVQGPTDINQATAASAAEGAAGQLAGGAGTPQIGPPPVQAPAAYGGASTPTPNAGAVQSAMDYTARQAALNSAVAGQPSSSAPGGGAAATGTGDPAAAAPTSWFDSLDKSKWDSDGFAKPAWLPESFGKLPVPAGRNAQKWTNPNHVTPKYVVGQIQADSDANRDGLISLDEMKVAAEGIAKAYPGSTWNGKDKITIPGVGTMDVVGGMSDDGKGVIRWGGVADKNGNPIPQRGAGRSGSAATMPYVNSNRDLPSWMSNNTQAGGDALQAIYRLLGPLMGDILKGSALKNVLGG